MLDKRIGILGGGQLGKMLCQDGSKLGLDLHILEKNDSYPAAAICSNITYGDFKNYDDVYKFGQDKDIITVEIEAVNTDALHKLESEGKKIYPQPDVLDTIKNKGIQKTFYADHGLPTSHFELFANAHEVRDAVGDGKWNLPFVQKSQTDGYDGQGVKIIRSVDDLDQLLDVPCLLEQLVDIQTEIAVIVARTPSGESSTFPVVEMEFHPTANLVEFLFAPSKLTEQQQAKATEIARTIADKMGIVGLLAVELFLTKSGDILINEVAPRPHNSGHHTIEGNVTSQYEQHLRAILDLPLGDTSATGAAVMINLLGSEGSTGTTVYQNIEQCLAVNGAHFHLYGKPESRPYRKMGHATVISDTLEDAIEKVNFIKNTLIIKGDNEAS